MTTNGNQSARNAGRNRQPAGVTNEVVLALIQQNTELVKSIIEMARVQSQPALPAPVFKSVMEAPYGEDVEDAQWQHQQGLIDDTELSRIMSLAGLPNNQITFA